MPGFTCDFTRDFTHGEDSVGHEVSISVKYCEVAGLLIDFQQVERQLKVKLREDLRACNLLLLASSFHLRNWDVCRLDCLIHVTHIHCDSGTPVVFWGQLSCWKSKVLGHRVTWWCRLPPSSEVPFSSFYANEMGPAVCFLQTGGHFVFEYPRICHSEQGYVWLASVVVRWTVSSSLQILPANARVTTFLAILCGLAIFSVLLLELEQDSGIYCSLSAFFFPLHEDAPLKWPILPQLKHSRSCAGHFFPLSELERDSGIDCSHPVHILPALAWARRACSTLDAIVEHWMWTVGLVVCSSYSSVSTCLAVWSLTQALLVLSLCVKLPKMLLPLVLECVLAYFPVGGTENNLITNQSVLYIVCTTGTLKSHWDTEFIVRGGSCSSPYCSASLNWWSLRQMWLWNAFPLQQLLQRENSGSRFMCPMVLGTPPKTCDWPFFQNWVIIFGLNWFKMAWNET